VKQRLAKKITDRVFPVRGGVRLRIPWSGATIAVAIRTRTRAVLRAFRSGDHRAFARTLAAQLPSWQHLAVFSLSSADKTAIAALVEFAALREHWYRPQDGHSAPGLDHRYVLVLGIVRPYRCVFSISLLDGTAYRHLSVTAFPGDHGEIVQPNVLITIEIATAFGLAGAHDGTIGDDWAVQTWDDGTVSLLQPVAGLN
jgi:hypothetical protein